MGKVLILNLPGLVLKAGSRWYNTTRKDALLKYYPYPWFMGYTSSLLKVNGYEVDFKDAVAMEWSTKKAIDYVETASPKYLVCEPTWVSFKDDKQFLKSLDKNIVKIAVGNLATNFPHRCLELGVDYVVVGEYEFSILKFLQSGGLELPVNFVNQTKQDYQFPDLIEDLDQFPFPDREGTPIQYYNEPSCYGNNVVMISSRGCRLKCDFCVVEGFYGKHIYRTRSVKNVVDEMEYLKSQYEFDEIYFDDDNMASRKRHLIGICQEIIARKLDISWLCMGDGLIDDETLEWLSLAGCTTYKFGLEHLDREVLKAIPKPLKPERMEAIIRKCQELGMRVYLNLVLGLPQSTREKDQTMIRRVISLKPDLLQLGIATPYPGTIFHIKARLNGWLQVDDLTRYDVTGKSVVSYPNYSADEITEVFNQGWRSWYRNVIMHQPKTLSFFIRSEIKREGFLPTLMKSARYLARILHT